MTRFLNQYCNNFQSCTWRS